MNKRLLSMLAFLTFLLIFVNVPVKAEVYDGQYQISVNPQLSQSEIDELSNTGYLPSLLPPPEPAGVPKKVRGGLIQTYYADKYATLDTRDGYVIVTLSNVGNVPITKAYGYIEVRRREDGKLIAGGVKYWNFKFVNCKPNQIPLRYPEFRFNYLAKKERKFDIKLVTNYEFSDGYRILRQQTIDNGAVFPSN